MGQKAWGNPSKKIYRSFRTPCKSGLSIFLMENCGWCWYFDGQSLASRWSVVEVLAQSLLFSWRVSRLTSWRLVLKGGNPTPRLGMITVPSARPSNPPPPKGAAGACLPVPLLPSSTTQFCRASEATLLLFVIRRSSFHQNRPWLNRKFRSMQFTYTFIERTVLAPLTDRMWPVPSPVLVTRSLGFVEWHTAAGWQTES